MTVADDIAIAAIRALCFALPEVTEKAAWGAPTFRVGGKIFAQPAAGQDRPALTAPAAPGAQGALVDANPERYFVPAYVGPRGWVGIWVDGDVVDWEPVAELALSAYEIIAPRKLLAAHAATLPTVGALAATAASAAARAAQHADEGADAEHRRQVDDAMRRIQAICAAWPETSDTGGRWPNFQVRGKTFANLIDNHHGDGILALWSKAPPGAQGMLIDIAPDRYYIPPYMGHHGWIGIRLDREPHWDEIEGILQDAYRMTAPRKLLAEIDARTPGGAAR